MNTFLKEYYWDAYAFLLANILSKFTERKIFYIIRQFIPRYHRAFLTCTVCSMIKRNKKAWPFICLMGERYPSNVQVRVPHRYIVIFIPLRLVTTIISIASVWKSAPTAVISPLCMLYCNVIRQLVKFLHPLRLKYSYFFLSVPYSIIFPNFEK